jgi:hypothetical protein
MSTTVSNLASFDEPAPTFPVKMDEFWAAVNERPW